MNLLTGDDTQQQQPGSNVANYPPNWQYPPPPYPMPQQQNAYYPPPTYPPPQRHAYYPPLQNVPNLSYGGLPPPHPSQTTPPPQPNNTLKSNEGGDNASKWTLEEDRRLVKSWINVSTNPLIGADQKKFGFWTKVTQAFNQAAPSGSAKKPPNTLNSRWNRAAPLVSKWVWVCHGREKPSGTNKDDVIQNAHDLYELKMGKQFNLMH